MFNNKTSSLLLSLSNNNIHIDILNAADTKSKCTYYIIICILCTSRYITDVLIFPYSELRVHNSVWP